MLFICFVVAAFIVFFFLVVFLVFFLSVFSLFSLFICFFFPQTAKHWGSNLRYREWESVTPILGS